MNCTPGADGNKRKTENCKDQTKSTTYCFSSKEAYGTNTNAFFSGTYIQFGFFPLILRPRFADIVV